MVRPLATGRRLVTPVGWGPQALPACAGVAWHARGEISVDLLLSQHAPYRGSRRPLLPGLLLAGSPRSKKWWDLGTEILRTQLSEQIEEDGLHLERSTCYHRYTVDFYVHYALLARDREGELPPWLDGPLQRMAQALLAFRRPDGRLPSLGDEDGGRFLPLGPVDPLDPAPTALLASSVLGWATEGESEEARWEMIWLTGPPRGEAIGETPGVAGLSLFPDSGFALIRQGDDYLAASAGIQRTSRTCTGHVHDDALGIELWFGGESVFCDPGTYSYTGDPTSRAWYRGAAAHSGLLASGAGDPPTDRPFAWDDLRVGRLAARSSDSRHVAVDLRVGLVSGHEHRRLILWDRDLGWLIWDRIWGDGPVEVRLRHQLSTARAAVHSQTTEPRTRLRLPTCDVWMAGPMGAGTLVPSPVSTRYGKSAPALAFVAEGKHGPPVDALSLVRPRGGDKGSVRVAQRDYPSTLLRRVRVEGPAGEKRVVSLVETHGTDIAPGEPMTSTIRLRWSGPAVAPRTVTLQART